MHIAGNNVSNECGCFLDMEQDPLLQEALSSVNSIKQYWDATYAFSFLLSYLRILFLVTALPLSKAQVSSKSYRTHQVRGICGLNHLLWTHTCCQQVFHQFKMTLLSSFHQRCWATQLYISSCLNKEVSNFREASTAGQGQGCFLRFFCLCVNICPWETKEPSLTWPHTAWGGECSSPPQQFGSLSSALWAQQWAVPAPRYIRALCTVLGTDHTVSFSVLHGHRISPCASSKATISSWPSRAASIRGV